MKLTFNLLRTACVAGVLVLAVGAFARTAAGYEFSTHAAMTREAFARWTGDPGNLDVLDRLGLTPKKDSLGSVYFSMSSVPQERLASPKDNTDFGRRHFDAANPPSLADPPKFESIAGWLMLGAIREDDVPFDAYAVENTPQDEPLGPFVRVFNHFYDPFFDRALFVAATVGSPAPDWAILGIDKSNSHANQFAIVDAREAMWRALTLDEYRSEPFLVRDLGFSPTPN